jgi:Fe/S biogenesis protein NfuA
MMSDAVVTLTGAARDKVLEFMKAEGRSGLALRMAIAGRGPGGFQYQLGFITDAERKSGDVVSDAGGFELVVDAASVDDLRGTTVDFVESRQGAGFKIDNPNPLWRDPLAAQVQKILDEEINPAVQSHGGFVSLLDVEDGRAYIRLGGGCQGCGMADVTLKQGIEVRIKELVPAITEVVDTTDHAGGSNPYYRPGKGGRSAVQG